MNDQEKTSPKWTKKYPDNTIKNSRHAEEHALQLYERLTRNKSRCKIKKVVVIRVKKDGTLGMAKPCKQCQKRLEESGVNPKAINYSNELGILSR